MSQGYPHHLLSTIRYHFIALVARNAMQSDAINNIQCPNPNCIYINLYALRIVNAIENVICWVTID